MSEVSTDTNDVFKNGLIRHMDRISSITISVKDEPVLFTFLEDGGFMIEGNTFIDLMFRDPEKTKDRLVSYSKRSDKRICTDSSGTEIR